MAVAGGFEDTRRVKKRFFPTVLYRANPTPARPGDLSTPVKGSLRLAIVEVLALR